MQFGTDCGGGMGGNGSVGTGGRGGAGGDSIGIAWLGSTGPTLNGTVVTADQPTATGITTGAHGTGGAGGLDGSGNPNNSGVGANGTSNAVQQFH